MNSREIRESFIDYFKGKGHKSARGSSVVPSDDPTLLFTNAGMNQFKPIFLGEQKPIASRLVNSQKCIRVSGKHNDLEEVGLDTYHHTFFEMLGNWSFGDYYKEEAIQWAWALFTEIWQLDKNRLWVTVYNDDDEAFDLWTKKTDISPERVLRFGKKYNFWEMGETGPCGPCSEIHYYVGNKLSKQTPDGLNSSDEYWELWNLVFIQSNRDENGNLHDLPSKHVDTGLGLERITAVLQGKNSNYDTDLFLPIFKKIEKISDLIFKTDPAAFQVIADHIRMLSFSIADGVMPSNEGRGYVLRRILRRASRFGRRLNLHEPFLHELVETVGEILGDVYPEVIDKKSHICQVLKAEETSFNATLDRGLTHFDKVVEHLADNVIPGKEAFRLYDTYGFPLDLTQLMAREKGLSVDEIGFDKEMKQQKLRAKSSGKFRKEAVNIKWNIISEGSDSKFVGFEQLSCTSAIRQWSKPEDEILIILDQTPFYAESGGQIGDTGVILYNGITLQVMDTKKDGETYIHYCKGEFDPKKATQQVQCNVNEDRRRAIQLNHTATHLLHSALREVLGDHVHQAGSLVASDYLRFDLTHFEKITPKEIIQIESLVNQEIQKNTTLDVSIKSFEEAQQEGAQSLFGEKYGDKVRMVSVGDYSKELCGGTHTNQTGDIGFIKIIEESSLASGVRRIVAVTGREAVKFMQNQTDIIHMLQAQFNSSAEDLSERVRQLIQQKKELEKALKKGSRSVSVDVKSIVEKSEKIGDVTFVRKQVDASSVDELKSIGDSLLSVLKSGVGVLGMTGSEKPTAVIVVTSDLIKKGIKAGDLSRSIGAVMGGGGGGKPHLATAGGKDNSKLKDAIDESYKIVQDAISS